MELIKLGDKIEQNVKLTNGVIKCQASTVLLIKILIGILAPT